jgi:hypothetical protein
MILKLMYIWLVFYSILSLLMHGTMNLKRNYMYWCHDHRSIIFYK